MTPSSYGVQSILTPGPPTEEQATPPAQPIQPVCSASTRGAPSLWFQAPDLGPAHLAVLDEANQVFKAVVAEEGGLQHWPVLARQHHGDGICGGVKGQPRQASCQQHLWSA